MPVIENVADVDDVRLADYRCLTDVELRRRAEPAEGLFIAEGELVICRALAAGYQPRSVLLSAKWLPGVIGTLGDRDVPIYVGTEDLLRRVTGFHVHRGALASMRRRPLPAVAELLAAAGRLVVLEGVNSHTNLGAIFRSAAALGMDAVVLSPNCADPLYRRSVRVSMGEVFAVPYARADEWPAGLLAVREAGFSLFALTPDPTAIPLDDVKVADADRVALVMGAEGTGLSARALAIVDRSVRIPMSRGVDSLNVAAATAVACYVLGRR